MHSEDSASHFPTLPPNTFYRATSLHLLEAMAQFIHLLLLLGMCHVTATYVYERQVWLLEGNSATFPFPKDRTIKYCGRGGNKCKCESKCESDNSSLPGVTVTDSNLTITNFTRENDQINLCYDGSNSGQCAHLNVSIGCSESSLITFAKGQTKHNVTTAADCRRLCTEDPTCQYFTFYKNSETCFLMTSRDDMLVQLHSYTVSGYPWDGCGLRFYQDPKSWIGALQYCHSKNSALVQITNQRVQDAVNSLLQNESGLDGGVWIGLERSIFGGVKVPWQWISGERVNVTHWNSSSFVDPLNNHCGKIIWVKRSREFKWLDEYCHEKLPFICRDLKPSS